jgi:hypothetical protein|tara:strand:- start:1394 stop:1951 length:558 start_codon:yes stop_codon:yes gene_type:complete
MKIGKKIATTALAIFFLIPNITNAASIETGYDYQLYKNFENLGILIFPKDRIIKDLDQYVQQKGFNPIESGKAVMRFGLKNENQTFMMPKSVQEKYSMTRFIVLQVIANQNMVVGIYDPQFGLTLPGPIYDLDGIKKNIPKTLNQFRKHLNKRETKKKILENHKNVTFSNNNATNFQSRVMSKLH